MLDVVHASGELLKKDVVCAHATVSLRRSRSALESKLSNLKNESFGRKTSDPYCAGGGRAVELSGPFACIRDIEIADGGRRASIDVSAGRNWQTTTPALILDAAWRIAVVDVNGPEHLFVPGKIGKLILPLQAHREPVREGATWEVLSSRPTLSGDGVSWNRTEVVDQQGVVRLVVEDSLAKTMA